MAIPAPESKLPDVGTTIFTVMSRLAEDCGAINLSQGFPDFQPPGELVELVGHHLAAGRNQYPPMIGVASLREKISQILSGLYGIRPDPDTEITVSSGGTEALFCAIHAVVRAGDEVIIFDPAYDSYAPAIRLAGGQPVHIPLLAPRFEPDWERLERSLNRRTRLVIINTPHNPTGAVLTGERSYHREEGASAIRAFRLVRTADHKLVAHHSGEVELYDLGNDPDERDNVAADRPDLVRDLRRRLHGRFHFPP